MIKTYRKTKGSLGQADVQSPYNCVSWMRLVYDVWGAVIERKVLVFSVLFLLVTLPIIYLVIKYRSPIEAAWYDDAFAYRQTVAITNAGTAQTDFQVAITLNTSALVTAGKMQSDCDDIRITDIGGKVLPHWIETGTNACNTTTTKIWTRIPSLPTSGATVFLYYGNPSSVSNRNSSVLATSCSGMNAYLASGLYFVDPDGSGSTSPVQAYCDMTTDSGGWTLVASWSTAQEWTKTSTSISSVFGTTALNAVSSNFGNLSINDFRILASDAVTTTGGSAYADWYYHYNTATTWKEVWAPTSNTGGHVGDGYESTTPRQALKSFNSVYNIKFSYSVAQTWNNLSDWGYTGAATSGCLANYWAALTTAGNSFGVYSTNSYTGSDGANCGGGVADGSLALCPSDQANCIPGQDMSVQNAKIGYDDGGAWAKFGSTAITNVGGTAGVDATTKLWWLIRSSTPINNSFSVASPTNEEKSLGPVAYWKFDEGTGLPKDSTSNAINTTTNTGTWATEDQCISGKCLKFDNQQSTINNNPKFNLDSNVSYSVWFKLTGTNASWPAIMGRNPHVSYALRRNQNDYNVFFEWGYGACAGSTYTSYSFGQITDRQWHFFSMTQDGTNMKLYLDGQLKTTIVLATFCPDTSVFTLGNTMTGYLDEAKIYNYARTAAQIKSDFASKGSGSVKGTAASLGSSAKNNDALSNGLVGYWKMDESAANSCTGGVNDSCDTSGNSNDSAWNGTATSTSGKFGNGVTLDGDSDYLSLADSTSLSPSTQITMSAWVYPTLITGQRRDIIYGSSGYFLGINADGNATSYIHNGAWVQAAQNTGTTPQLNTWTLITSTYDGSQLITYVNGVAVRTISVTGSITDPSTIKIGSSPGGVGEFFQGNLDEARIYNRALSPREVRDLYAWAPGPVGYFKLDEGTGSSTYDSSGLNHNSTSMSNTTWTTGKFGKAVSFNGTNTNIVVGDNADYENKNFTFSAWVYPSGNSSAHKFILARRPGTEDVYYWDVDDSNKLRLVVYDPAYNGASSTTTVPQNQWSHVAVTYTQGGTAYFYINGIRDATTFVAGSALNLTSTKNMYFGMQEGGIYPFAGKIDDVRIYNYARNSKQIVEDMNAGHPLGGSPVGSQVGYWKFDEGKDNSCSGGSNDVCNSGSGGSSLDGVATSTTWNNNGKFGKALEFNGSSSYVTSSIPNPGSATSISFWGKMDSYGADTGDYSAFFDLNMQYQVKGIEHFTNGAPGSRYLRFWGYYSGGTIQLNKAITPIDGSEAAFLGKWHHYAISFTSGANKLYIDGKLAATDTNVNNVVFDASNILNIGRKGGGTRYFDGMLDEVKIYNAALTADEIKLDYNRGSAMVLGTLSDTSGLSGGSVASSSAGAAYCVPGDTATCNPPVGEWNMDEKTGTNAYDTSGNNNTGTMVGFDSSQWTTGKVGAALQFDATDSEINLASEITLAEDTPWTIEYWFYQTAGIDNKMTIGKTDTNYNRFYHITSGTEVRFHSNDGSLITSSLGSGDTRGGWHHLTIVNTNTASSNMLAYLDGVQTDTDSMTNTLFYINNIGNPYTGTTYIWNGKLDQVRIFNYARTPAQIAYDYNRGAPVGWWKMDECQGIAANDSSGNGNSGTITIGATGTNTSAGTCTGSAGEAWKDGAIGKYNSSLEFDGTDDYLRKTSFTHDLRSRFTLSTWVKSSTLCTTSAYLIELHYGKPIMRIASCKLATTLRDPGDTTYNNYSANTAALTNDIWHHLAITYDTDTDQVKFYVDGRQDGSATHTAIGGTAATTLEVGGRSTVYFPGQIDDVRIYNYALTPQQIKTVYNSGAAVQFAPLTGSP